jgi:nicotinate-nucleotide adenylyltransferase
LSPAAPFISPRFDAPIDACAADGEPFRLGLFGGTFDPVHVGHLHIAECAREQFALDGVLFIPTGCPVRKLADGFSAAEDRHAMLRAAVAGNARFDVSRVEVERRGATYTIDTLRILKERYGKRAALFFIVGADAAADLATWKDAAEIARLVTVLCAKRSIPATTGPPLVHNGIRFTMRDINSCPIDVSSRQLREWVGQGRSIQYLVPDAVYAYIREQRLYREWKQEQG